MKLSHIYKTYHNKLDHVEVFQDMSLELPSQGFVLVYGASRTGKTTLFNMIAGLDHDFTGEITGIKKIEYFNQSIELYENLTVLENLELVNNDVVVEQLLSQFELQSLKDTKVKKLSNGEKRRVQMIRSSLVNPDLLICDEPTASLDDNNAKIVCTLLKEMSKSMTVLIATHDQSLFESYVNIIYEIKDFKIQKIKSENIVERTYKINQDENRTFKDHMQACLMNIKAHKTYTFMTIILLILMIWAGYSTIYYSLYSNADYQKSIWQYSSNLIEGLPTKFELDPIENKYRFYDDYDLYNQKIVDQVKHKENIIGYSLIYDTDSFTIFSQFDDSNENTLQNLSSLEEMKKLYGGGFQSYITDVFQFHYTEDEDGNISAGYNYPISPYVLINESKKDENNHVLRSFVYQIIDFDKLNLQYGTIPTNDNDIVIGIDLAETLCHSLSLSTLDQLINRNITIDTISNNPDQNYFINARISGITSFHNQFENRIYFKDGAYSKLLADLYHYDHNKAQFHSLKLLTDPRANVEDIIDDLNQNIPSKYNQFSLFNGTTNTYAKQYQEVYQNTTMVVVVSIIIIVFALSYLLFIKFFFRKQLTKEYTILNRYGYSSMKNEFLTSLLLSTLLIIIIFTFFPVIVSLFNQMSLKYFHRDLYSVNYIMMAINCLLIFGLYSSFMLLSSYSLTRKK